MQKLGIFWNFFSRVNFTNSAKFWGKIKRFSISQNWKEKEKKKTLVGRPGEDL
jgi:hypothetical protein